MNGFFLQSTTTPRKACKGIESALQKNKLLSGRLLVLVLDPLNVVLSHSRLKKIFLRAPKKKSAWWSLIGASMMESDQGKWVSLIGIWDREAWWCDPHKSWQISATA
ncbi:unnamed protein product, partial [Prunus brigantina]